MIRSRDIFCPPVVPLVDDIVRLITDLAFKPSSKRAMISLLLRFTFTEDLNRTNLGSLELGRQDLIGAQKPALQ